MSLETYRPLLLAGLIALSINVVATILILRISRLSGWTRAGLLIIVWAFPVVGAVTCYYFLTDDTFAGPRTPPIKSDEAYRTALLLSPDPPGPTPRGTDPQFDRSDV